MNPCPIIATPRLFLTFVKNFSRLVEQRYSLSVTYHAFRNQTNVTVNFILSFIAAVEDDLFRNERFLGFRGPSWLSNEVTTARSGHSDSCWDANRTFDLSVNSTRRAVERVAGVVFPDVPKSDPLVVPTGRLN
jgi:hypothetical protein